MQVNRTNVKNKKLVCVILVVIHSIFILLLGKTAIDYYIKPRYINPDVYYQKMLSSLKTSNEVAITDVFDFEFDKAYVVHRVTEAYADQEYFLKTLKLDKKVFIPTLEYEGVNRILFVKDNKLVYDFIYETHTIDINELGETGVWITPDAILKMNLEYSTLHINIK